MRASTFRSIPLVALVTAAVAGCGGPPADPDRDAGPDPVDEASVWDQLLGAEVDNVTSDDGWSTPRLLAEPVNVGVDSTGGWTDSLTASSDGRVLFFGYTPIDYWTFESNAALGQIVFEDTGPSRAASHTGNAFQLYRAELGEGGWTVEHHAANPAVDVFTASADTNDDETMMVFTTFRFDPSYQTNIEMAERVDGAWVQRGPLPAPINIAACTSDNGFLVGTDDDLTLYFESTRTTPDAGPCGTANNIFRTRRIDGVWGSVEPVPGVNGAAPEEEDVQPSLSADGSEIFWTSVRASDGVYGLYRADAEGAGFTDARPFLRIASFAGPWENKVVRIGEPTVVRVPEGEVAYFTCGVAGSTTAEGEPADIEMRACFSRRPLPAAND